MLPSVVPPWYHGGMVDTQTLSIRLPRDLYEELRREAFEARQPMNQIITDGLRMRLQITTPEKYGDLCALFEAAWHHAVPDSLDDLPPVTSPEARRLALLATEAVNYR
jgi:hypothetical protein